jgi:hypothetical protein
MNREAGLNLPVDLQKNLEDDIAAVFIYYTYSITIRRK